MNSKEYPKPLQSSASQLNCPCDNVASVSRSYAVEHEEARRLQCPFKRCAIHVAISHYVDALKSQKVQQFVKQQKLINISEERKNVSAMLEKTHKFENYNEVVDFITDGYKSMSRGSIKEIV
eukprot:TRINITY_DN3192_c0_g3_i3.p2 TRINITY_DN3192_c0_g3~~TRINITY_DN3192_c0_g3_i3.p2  ORF type:complete len:122 (+),score=15.75 TRINITY_DN3192_c0_g3_i3:854-1219(+)